MILCVNANAAIDRTVVVSPFRLNEIHRPQRVLALPGGKGCNVARALRRLGQTPVVTGWVGGHAGQFIEDGLQLVGIQSDFVRTDSESRTCLSILDAENDTLTEIYEKGEPVRAGEIEELLERFGAVVGNCEAVTLSGSLPDGVPHDFYARLTAMARDAGVPVLLDSSGEPLRRGLAARPHLVKPNRKEFADVTGGEFHIVNDFVEPLVVLSLRTDAVVVLSLGAEGALAARGREVWHARSPRVAVRSAVGSGDCMLAGLAYGLTHDFSPGDMLKYGVAAGTANALQLGAGNFNLDDFEELLEAVTVAEGPIPGSGRGFPR